MQIGEKIRTLRCSKELTQAELAAALSVSAQTVSKWEHHRSAPDVSVLPALARYFGITMDELFDYRLDALSYKDRFVRFLFDNGILQFGTFTLKSGRVSPYLVRSGTYRTGGQITKLGEFYAECIRANPITRGCLVGVSTEDVPLLVATGMTLFTRYGIDFDYCANFDGQESSKGIQGDMLLLTDVFTSGVTLRRALDRIREATGRVPSTVIVSVDRAERSENGSFSARHEIERDYGIRIHSIVTVDDIIRAAETGVIHADDSLDALITYKEWYKGE